MNPLTFDGLPTDVIAHCLSFVGPGQYRYMAGTCKLLRDTCNVEKKEQNEQEEQNAEEEQETPKKKYIYEKKTTWDTASLSIAHAELCLEDERKLQRPLGEKPAIEMIALTAAKNGNEDMLEWAHQSGFEGNWNGVFKAAAAKGRVNILQWAQRNDVDLYHTDVLLSAAEYGHVEVLNHIWPSIQTGAAFPSLSFRRMLGSAIEDGHIPVLEWMIERNIIDLNVSDTQGECVFLAAEYDHVHVLDWLIENGVEVDILLVATRGALNGRISVLEWARNRGFEWSTDVCAWAAHGGHLATLQWLREQDCPWDADVIHFSQIKGHDDVVIWAREHGCPEP